MSVSFLFTATATTEIYTLSLHDALPIYTRSYSHGRYGCRQHAAAAAATGAVAELPDERRSRGSGRAAGDGPPDFLTRSEEHTSELQSQSNLVCRLLLEKKKHIWSHWCAR